LKKREKQMSNYRACLPFSRRSNPYENRKKKNFSLVQGCDDGFLNIFKKKGKT